MNVFIGVLRPSLAFSFPFLYYLLLHHVKCMQLQPHEKNPSLRGSSIDYDFESVSTANQRKRRMVAPLDPDSTSGSSANIAPHVIAAASSIDIMHFSSEVDGHSTLHGLSSRRSVNERQRLDANQGGGGSLHIQADNPPGSCSTVKNIKLHGGHMSSDINADALSNIEMNTASQNNNSSSGSEDGRKISVDKKNDIEIQHLMSDVSEGRNLSLNGFECPKGYCSGSSQNSVLTVKPDIIGSDSSAQALKVDLMTTENKRSTTIGLVPTQVSSMSVIMVIITLSYPLTHIDKLSTSFPFYDSRVSLRMKNN